jgi:hypothetical protein
VPFIEQPGSNCRTLGSICAARARGESAKSCSRPVQHVQKLLRYFDILSLSELPTWRGTWHGHSFRRSTPASGYAVSRRISKRVEETFGCMKTVGGLWCTPLSRVPARADACISDRRLLQLTEKSPGSVPRPHFTTTANLSYPPFTAPASLQHRKIPVCLPANCD